MVPVGIGEGLIGERHRGRVGDPRVSPEGRELFRRLTTGDLSGEFQAALDEVSARWRASRLNIIEEYMAVRVVGGDWPEGPAR